MQFAKLALNAVVGADDERFAFLGRFPFPTQEFDSKGAILSSVGENSLRHHDAGTIVDFIEDGLLNSSRFHRCSAYESGCLHYRSRKRRASYGE